jgi:multimeric flavodoxin WrbA
MKVLAINGSYRKNGNTARIIEMVSNQIREITSDQQKDFEFEIVNLGQQDIGNCRGCRVCFDRGEVKCPLKDDLLAIREKMQVADGLIVASPVYVNDVSGLLKNWIDRLAFVCHRPEFAGKHAYLIATVGQGPTSHALKTMNMALSTWGFSIVGQASFKMGALMEKEQARKRFHSKTQEIARNFFKALDQDKLVSPSFVSLMTFRIQQDVWRRNPQPGTVDYAYWQSQGWIHPQRDYYTGHKARRIKVHLARFAGAILAPFVT